MSAFENLGILQEIRFRKGADFSMTLHLFQDKVGGTPYDFTGCQFKATVESRLYIDDKWEFDLIGTPGPSGMVEIRLTVDTIEDIPVSPESLMAKPVYDWYCNLRLADGLVVPFAYGPAYCMKRGPIWE